MTASLTQSWPGIMNDHRTNIARHIIAVSLVSPSTVNGDCNVMAIVMSSLSNLGLGGEGVCGVRVGCKVNNLQLHFPFSFFSFLSPSLSSFSISICLSLSLTQFLFFFEARGHLGYPPISAPEQRYRLMQCKAVFGPILFWKLMEIIDQCVHCN